MLIFIAGLNNGNVGYINAYHKANKLAIGGYYFNGVFNRAGVLRGTARLSGVIVANDLDFPAITGELRGLIGAEGIVGAFLGSKLAGEVIAAVTLLAGLLRSLVSKR